MKTKFGVSLATALAVAAAALAPVVQAAPFPPPPSQFKKPAVPKPPVNANNNGCDRSTGQGVSRC